MFGLLIAALAGVKAVSLANDYATISNLNRQQQEAFQRTVNSGREVMKKIAERDDLYWDDILGSYNSNFYSDGSLRKDWITNKYYQKGQFYCNCMGSTAGKENELDSTKWAPW